MGSRVVSLQGFDRELLFLERKDTLQGGESGSEGGDHGDTVQDRFAADSISSRRGMSPSGVLMTS